MPARKPHRPSFRQIVERVASGNVCRLIHRVRLADLLVKKSFGRKREAARVVRNRSLIALRVRFGDLTPVSPDTSLYPG